MATSDIDWPELQKVAKEKRYELHLNGAEVKKRVEKLDGELPADLYALKALNFLEVTRAGLRTLSVLVSNFTQLQNLVLHNNALTTLPETLGNLKQLRFLDVSFNELESLPASLGQIPGLFNLNVSHNKLSSLPVLENPSLHIVDLSYNLFTEVPLGICNSRLATLDTLNMSNNTVERVPHEVGQLVSLKTFVLDENRVRELPSELLRCTRLKEVHMRNNPLTDKRLAKLVTDKTNSMKAVLDYLTVALQRSCSVKENSDSAGKDAQVRKEDAKALRRKQKRGASASQNDDNDSGSSKHRIVITKPEASKRLEVTVGTEVLELRPFIVLCVVRNLRLTDGTTAKRFFQLQNRLHDDDSLCAQRHAATLATHDLSAIHPPLRYDAGRPDDVEVQALGRQRSSKAIDLVREMHAEAERMRKEKKRNQVSGVHKYLDLLVGRSLFAFLFDAQQTPISFPPLTNAEATRVSKDTRDVLVEVTSPSSLDVCKRVMEAFLKGLFEIGCVPSAAADEGAAASEPETDRCQLVIEQVRVVNATDGQLRVCYPSRTDLQLEDDDASRFEVVWKRTNRNRLAILPLPQQVQALRQKHRIERRMAMLRRCKCG